MEFRRISYLAARLGLIVIAASTAILLLSSLRLPCLISISFGSLDPWDRGKLTMYVEEGDVLMVRVRAKGCYIGLIASDYSGLGRGRIISALPQLLEDLLKGRVRLIASAKGELKGDFAFDRSSYVILTVTNPSDHAVDYRWDVRKVSSVIPRSRGLNTSLLLYSIGIGLTSPLILSKALRARASSRGSRRYRKDGLFPLGP